MNQLHQGESSGIQLAKRGRGRPCKDPSKKRPQPGIGIGVDSMVGRAVTGVIEGSFHGGYLLTVKIANSNTNFRGVVFKPGNFIPVTPENDVAPHLQMVTRDDAVHFPNGNPNDSRGPGLAVAKVPSKKRKYSTPRTVVVAPCVHPVGERGTVVPVVLQPVNMVQPLSILPPNDNTPGSSQASDGRNIIENSSSNQQFSITKPALFNFGTGRMTQLLQAVQENMKENQMHVLAGKPTFASQNQ